MSFEDSSDCLCRDWVGDDGIDVVGSLDSIVSLACGDLVDDGSLGGGRKLDRTSRRRYGSVGKEVPEYPGDSRLADTQVGGNFMSRMTIRGQRNDVFLLSRGDGVHGGIDKHQRCGQCLNILNPSGC